MAGRRSLEGVAGLLDGDGRFTVFYSKEEQCGAEPCFAPAKQSFETVVANSRSETLNIPCKSPNLHASCDAAGYFSLFCPTFIELQLGQKQSRDSERHAAANGRGNMVFVVWPL